MVTIRELSEKDFPDAVLFLSQQTAASPDSILKRLQWLSSNPAFTPEIPVGIAAFRGSKLCGTMFYIPHRFADGKQIRTCVMSALFYVSAESAGAGLPMFMKFRSLTDRYPVYAATANHVSASIWRKLGGEPVAGSDCEYLRPANFGSLGTMVFGRSSSHLLPLLPIRKNPRRAAESLTPIGLNECSYEASGESHSTMARVMRDRDLLRWKVYEFGQTVYRFRSHLSECYCIFQQVSRGPGQQISCIDIVDIWGFLDSGDWPELVGSIIATFGPDVISLRGSSPLARLEFAGCRFWKRKFKSPTAWLLDPNKLLQGQFLYTPLAGEA